MSIDSCYEGVIAKLTAQGKIKAISQKLISLKTHEERVWYVYEILESLEAFPKPLVVTKTEKVSTYYRNHGNCCFQNKEDYKAWQYYNLSLLHAPPTSDCYPIALANRSAVFYSLKKYKECLQDIKEVFSLKYPEKLKDKLSKRLALCEKNLCNDKDISDDCDAELNTMLSLPGPIDVRFPCASKKIEVVFSEEMGRHVIAKEDIKVGEVLVQENPYLTLLLKSQFLFCCSYCLSRNCNLLPCTECCFALYCSEECRKKAWKDYHSVECPLMPTLVQMEFTKLELLALRTTIKARNDYASWDDLFQTIDDAEANYDSEFRGHVQVEEQWVFDSKYYTSIHTLASNFHLRSISDIFQKSVTSAVFLHLLKVETNFLKCENNAEQSVKINNCVAALLLLHMMTSPTNMHGLSANTQSPDGKFVDEMSIASAPYAYLSLINHSCAPNVVRFHEVGTGRMNLYALRPIKKGMQLFDNYGPHHALQDRASRHDDLKFQYKFSCTCEACVDDWPTYFNVKRSSSLPSVIRKRKKKVLNADAIEKLQNGDKGMALELYKPLCELIEQLDDYAPCVEFLDCQESLKQCLSIIKGLVPYAYSQIVPWNANQPIV